MEQTTTKRSINKLWLLGLVVIAGVMIAFIHHNGGKFSSDPTSRPTAKPTTFVDPIIGHWNGIYYSFDDDELTPISANFSAIEIKDDGTFSMHVLDAPQEGVWKYIEDSDGTLIYNLLDGDGEYAGTLGYYSDGELGFILFDIAIIYERDGTK